MPKSLIIYRCCDRPKYVEQTFPHLVENTSDDAVILMADNSSTQEARDVHKAIFDKTRAPNTIYVYFGSRVGVWHIVYEAIKWYVENHGKPKYILLADDDCLVPSEKDPWNVMLESMLDSDLWDVVGCAENGDPCVEHPRDLMENPPPWPEGRHGGRGWILKGEGMARGRLRRYVGGACSGFSYSWYDRIIDPVELSIYWFTLMTAKYAGDPEEIIPGGGFEIKEGRCGHFAGYPITTFRHLDTESKESFADSEYPEYSDWMHHYSRGIDKPRRRRG